MRASQLDVLRQGRWLTLLAICVLLAYAALAVSAQFGGNLAGQGLDPVWAAAQQRGVLRVATDFGYAPFTGTRRAASGEQPYGFDIDLAQAIAVKLGLRAEFVPTSLESAYEAIAADHADVVISALPYAPEQGWRATFSTFYFNAGQVLVVPEASAVTSSAQLSGLTIGVALGSDADTFARNLRQNTPSLILHSNYDTAALAFADLRRGALDGVIADNTAALIALNQAPGLRFVPPALTLEPYAIAMSNRAFLLHERVNAALESLRSEGWFGRKTAEWFR